MRQFRLLTLALGLCLLCAASAHALSFNIDAPGDYLFGRPTSDDTIYETENPNADRSKNTARIAPAFGSPTSYLPNSGEYLTPNLVPGALNGGLVNAIGSAGAYTTGGVAGSSGLAGSSGVTLGSDGFPAVSGSTVQNSLIPNASAQQMVSGFSGYTEVTSDLYYDGGYLGTLNIPSIGVNTKVYQGTGDSILAKGAGHFEDTSIWGGNIGIAAHNRGVNTIFGQIHTLKAGDKITLTTKLGTKTYSVASVDKISYTDNTMLSSTSEDCITLITCVKNESSYRWCVRAIAD